MDVFCLHEIYTKIYVFCVIYLLTSHRWTIRDLILDIVTSFNELNDNEKKVICDYVSTVAERMAKRKEGRRLAFPLDVISDDDKDSFQE